MTTIRWWRIRYVSASRATLFLLGHHGGVRVSAHADIRALHGFHTPQAPKWLFYLAIVLLGLGGIATLAGVLDAFSHKVCTHHTNHSLSLD